MHHECRAFVARVLAQLPAPQAVVELGSTDVNGHIRDLLGSAAYTGVDTRPGRNVDVVADGATYRPTTAPDLVLCLETLEHAPRPERVVANAYRMLAPGGHLVITAACDPRRPHGVDGGGVGAEYYRNVDADELQSWIAALSPAVAYRRVEVDPIQGDVRALVAKPDAAPKATRRPRKRASQTRAVAT